MKTLKKLFSVSAIVALLGTLAPMYAFGATYSDELQDAYKYAYAHEVTTMTSIDNANMYGNLTRIALAKMIANYAINVLGMTPDTTKTCTFPDVPAALDAQYDNGVTKACQLGLMGVGIKNFNPNGIVTRAEFGTAFSRALNHDSDNLAEMNAATPYYKKHLEFLKSEGIMNQIDNPNQTEVRGYVMLMMMRADDSYSPETVEGCTATELLACITADDYDACIAACSQGEDEPEEPVGNGLVTISKVSAAAQQEVAYNAVKKNVGTIKLTAGKDGAVVSSIVVKRSGLGSNLVSVQLENSSKTVVTSARTMNANGEATVRFSPALTLKANESMKLDVIVNLLGTSANANETHTFAVIDANLANGKAEGSANLGTLRTTSYEVSSVTAGTIANSSIKAGETKSIAKVTLTMGKKAAIVNGFTLTKGAAAGQDFNKAFDNVKAYVNNKEAGKVTMTADKIIVSDLNVEKAAGESITVDLKANGIYIGGTSDTIVGFDATSDVDVVEKDTQEAMQLSNTTLPAGTVTLSAVELTMTKVSTGAQTVAPGLSNITLYNAKITSSTEFDVVNYTLTVKNPNGLSAFTNESIMLNIAGTPIEVTAADLTPVSTWAATMCSDNTSATYAACLAAGETPTVANGYTKTFTQNDFFTVSPNADTKVTITATAKNTAGGTHQFDLTLNTLRDVENSSNTIAVTDHVLGDITTIGAGSLTLKKSTVAAPNTRNIWANGSDLEVARFGLRAAAEDVTVSKVVFNKIAASAAANTYVGDLTAAISSARLVNVADGTSIASNGKINNEVLCSATDVATTVATDPCFGGTAGTTVKTPANITFDSLSLVAEKDEDLNVKLLVTTNSFAIPTAPANLLRFNVTIDPVDLSVDSSNAVELNAGTTVVSLALDPEYKLNVKSPEVTMTKESDSIFKVTIKNTDSTNNLFIAGLTARVKSVADNSSYQGNYFLRQEGSSVVSAKSALEDDITFAGIGTNYAVLNASFALPAAGMFPGAANKFVFTNDLGTVTPVEIAKNSSYTFEIYVDSDYVNPTTLMAEVSEVAYGTAAATATDSTESYTASAQ